MARSSFDRVSRHLKEHGTDVAAPAEVKDDVEMLVRRCDEVRGLGQAFGGVELSPYMKSLLRVSGLDRAATTSSHTRHTATAAVGV